jgi:hypothetical protein
MPHAGAGRLPHGRKGEFAPIGGPSTLNSPSPIFRLDAPAPPEFVIEENPAYPKSDWAFEVQAGDTRLGCEKWLEAKLTLARI